MSIKTLDMKEFFYVFIGGGAGSVLRYLIYLFIRNKELTSLFPWATFSINLIGSLLIGISYSLSERLGLSQEVRLLLTVGLCGGFTTFSTFSYENLNLLKSGMYTTFLLYVLSSFALGILATFAGVLISKA